MWPFKKKEKKEPENPYEGLTGKERLLKLAKRIKKVHKNNPKLDELLDSRNLQSKIQADGQGSERSIRAEKDNNNPVDFV